MKKNSFAKLLVRDTFFNVKTLLNPCDLVDITLEIELHAYRGTASYDISSPVVSIRALSVAVNVYICCPISVVYPYISYPSSAVPDSSSLASHAGSLGTSPPQIHQNRWFSESINAWGVASRLMVIYSELRLG